MADYRFRWQLPAPVAAVGCLGLVLLLGFLCIMPLFLAELMQRSLERLHLAPSVALLCVLGIFVGGLINLPMYRCSPPEVVPIERVPQIGPDGVNYTFRELEPPAPVIAVNLGGCVIPVTIAIWQVFYLLNAGTVPLSVLAGVTAVNIGVCYLAARPVQGIGITMPALLSPLVAVGLTWLLLLHPDSSSVRPGVAFVAGIFGPLVGADLLHLKDVRSFARGGMLSIGGAGTFDGIVLSGILAALLS